MTAPMRPMRDAQDTPSWLLWWGFQSAWMHWFTIIVTILCLSVSIERLLVGDWIDALAVLAFPLWMSIAISMYGDGYKRGFIEGRTSNFIDGFASGASIREALEEAKRNAQEEM